MQEFPPIRIYNRFIHSSTIKFQHVNNIYGHRKMSVVLLMWPTNSWQPSSTLSNLFPPIRHRWLWNQSTASASTEISRLLRYQHLTNCSEAVGFITHTHPVLVLLYKLESRLIYLKKWKLFRLWLIEQSLFKNWVQSDAGKYFTVK